MFSYLSSFTPSIYNTSFSLFKNTLQVVISQAYFAAKITGVDGVIDRVVETLRQMGLEQILKEVLVSTLKRLEEQDEDFRLEQERVRRHQSEERQKISINKQIEDGKVGEEISQEVIAEVEQKDYQGENLNSLLKQAVFMFSNTQKARAEREQKEQELEKIKQTRLAKLEEEEEGYEDEDVYNRVQKFQNSIQRMSKDMSSLDFKKDPQKSQNMMKAMQGLCDQMATTIDQKRQRGSISLIKFQTKDINDKLKKLSENVNKNIGSRTSVQVNPIQQQKIKSLVEGGVPGGKIDDIMALKTSRNYIPKKGSKLDQDDEDDIIRRNTNRVKGINKANHHHSSLYGGGIFKNDDDDIIASIRGASAVAQDKKKLVTTQEQDEEEDNTPTSSKQNSQEFKDGANNNAKDGKAGPQSSTLYSKPNDQSKANPNSRNSIPKPPPVMIKGSSIDKKLGPTKTPPPPPTPSGGRGRFSIAGAPTPPPPPPAPSSMMRAPAQSLDRGNIKGGTPMPPPPSPSSGASVQKGPRQMPDLGSGPRRASNSKTRMSFGSGDSNDIFAQREEEDAGDLLVKDSPSQNQDPEIRMSGQFGGMRKSGSEINLRQQQENEPWPFKTLGDENDLDVKLIHFEQVKLNDLNSTIWDDINQNRVHTQLRDWEFNAMEKYFARDKRNKSLDLRKSRSYANYSKFQNEAPGALESAPKKEIYILDSQVSQMVNIVLKGIYKQQSGNIRQVEDVARKLVQMDVRRDVGLNSQSVSNLLQAKLQVNSGEMQKILQNAKQVDKLAEPERFFYYTRHIPQVQQTLQAMLFLLNFDEEQSRLTYQLGSIHTICLDVQNNVNWKIFLGMAVGISNTLRSANKAVSGIELQSLINALSTKGYDKKTSLYHLLMAFLQQRNPKVIEYFAHLDVSCGTEFAFQETIEKIKGFKAGLAQSKWEIGYRTDKIFSREKGVEFHTQILPLLKQKISDVQASITKLEEFQERVIEDYLKIRRYLGYQDLNSVAKDKQLYTEHPKQIFNMMQELTYKFKNQKINQRSIERVEKEGENFEHEKRESMSPSDARMEMRRGGKASFDDNGQQMQIPRVTSMDESGHKNGQSNAQQKMRSNNANSIDNSNIKRNLDLNGSKQAFKASSLYSDVRQPIKSHDNSNNNSNNNKDNNSITNKEEGDIDNSSSNGNSNLYNNHNNNNNNQSNGAASNGKNNNGYSSKFGSSSNSNRQQQSNGYGYPSRRSISNDQDGGQLLSIKESQELNMDNLKFLNEQSNGGSQKDFKKTGPQAIQEDDSSIGANSESDYE